MLFHFLKKGYKVKAAGLGLCNRGNTLCSCAYLCYVCAVCNDSFKSFLLYMLIIQAVVVPHRLSPYYPGKAPEDGDIWIVALNGLRYHSAQGPAFCAALKLESAKLSR